MALIALEVAMKTSLILAAAALFATVGLPASTGTPVDGCGFTPASDANLPRLDRVQSAGTARICAVYLNSMEPERRR
jgi:hypothetical protein